MGSHSLQTPHSRVYRDQHRGRNRGDVEDLTPEGLPTSEYVKGVYVNRGERGAYRTNAQAVKAARRFAGVGYREGVEP